MEPHAIIASNRPELCAKRLARPVVGKHLMSLNPVIFCHKLQESAFRHALRIRGIEIPIYTHSIVSKDGSVPFGALRHYAMKIMKSIMKKNDYAFLLDDDLICIRLVQGMRAKGPSFRKLSSERLLEELEKLARATRKAKLPFFTVSFNADGKSGYDKNKPIRPAYSWSGACGFFKDTKNMFDKNFSVGADGEAQMRLLHLNKGKFQVMRHWGLCFEFLIDMAAYGENGARRRLPNLKEIVRRYPKYSFITTNNKSRRMTERPKKDIHQLKIYPKIWNQNVNR